MQVKNKATVDAPWVYIKRMSLSADEDVLVIYIHRRGVFALLVSTCRAITRASISWSGQQVQALRFFLYVYVQE